MSSKVKPTLPVGETLKSLIMPRHRKARLSLAVAGAVQAWRIAWP